MFIDFAALKAAVTLDQVADMLSLTTKQEGSQLRTACPACKSGGDRAIVLTPAKGLFYCFSAKKGGDCIALVAHVMGVGNNDAANFLADQIGTVPVPDRDTVLKERATAPKSPTRRQETVKEKSAPTFDPQAFASKLVYSDEVEALGLTEDTATKLGVGWHPQRKAVYFPMKDETGFIAGFIAFKDGKLVMPPKWLEQNKVVKLKRA